MNRQPSFQENICPVCGGAVIKRVDKVLGFPAPKFHCPDCGTDLKQALTPRVLWALLVVGVGIPVVYLFASWLNTLGLDRPWLVGISSGLFGGLWAWSNKLTFDGVVFKPKKKEGS